MEITSYKEIVMYFCFNMIMLDVMVGLMLKYDKSKDNHFRWLPVLLSDYVVVLISIITLFICLQFNGEVPFEGFMLYYGLTMVILYCVGKLSIRHQVGKYEPVTYVYTTLPLIVLLILTYFRPMLI